VIEAERGTEIAVFFEVSCKSVLYTLEARGHFPVYVSHVRCIVGLCRRTAG
jgi:hypothetical protein